MEGLGTRTLISREREGVDGLRTDKDSASRSTRNRRTDGREPEPEPEEKRNPWSRERHGVIRT